MAALSKRDIEMIFRAETDTAQRPVKELTSDVRKLRDGMNDLTKASDKNEQSLADLAATTRELEQAQKELGTARTLVTQLNAQAQAVDRVEERLAKAQKRYEDAKAAMEATEKPTRRLQQSFDSAARAVEANGAKLEQAKAQYAEVKASIEAIIGPVDSVQEAFRSIAVAQRDVTQGLSQAKEAATQFNREIAQNGKQAVADVRTEEQTLEAQRRNDALAETARKQRQRDEIEALLRGNAALEQQFADLAAAEQRAGQVDAFRQMAADSVSAQSAIQRIESTTQNATTAAQRLARTVQELINPAGTAAATLEGMDKSLADVEKRLSSGKLSMVEWANANNELVALQANLARVAVAIDNYQAQDAKLRSVSAAYEDQRAKVQALTQANVTADTKIEELTAELAREEKRLQSLGGELDRETVKLRELRDAMAGTGVDVNALPDAIGRIESTAKRAAPTIERVRNAVTPGKNKGFLGLDPYQLQNLGYQVNDVFTSIGSGMPIMQVFAQQGGQIVQLFPGLISGFVAWLPVIAPVGAALYIVASALGETRAQMQLMKEASGVIAMLGQANGWDVAKYKEVVASFREIGVSMEDASAAARIFVTEGLNPKAVDDFVVAAKNLSDVQGIDLKQATEEVTKAFTGGAEEVIKLDDKYHFLTDTQRENLIASKDTKDEYGEVNKAFTTLYDKLQDGAEFMRGPGTSATNTLRNAWNTLLGALDQSGVWDRVQTWISNTVVGLSQLINIGRRVAGLFNGVDINGGYDQKVGKIIENYGKAGGLDGIIKGATEDTRKQYAAGQANINRPRVNNADPGDGSRGRQREAEEATKRAAKEAEKARKKAASDAASEAKKREAEAKRLAKQYENEQDQLTSQLSRFTAQAMQGAQAPLEQQLAMAKQAVDEQFKALEDRLSEFRDKFGPDAKINGMSQADYAAQLAAQKQQITLNKQLGVYESNINDLLKSRDERLKSIKEQQDSGLLSAQQALDKAKEVTSEMAPAIDAAIFSARTFIASLKPSAETQALLDKFDRIRSQTGGREQDESTILRGQAQDGLDAEMQKVNDIMATRNALIAAANNLYDIGAISWTEKEKRIQDALTMTGTKLQETIANLRAFIEANKDLFPAEVYALAMAKLDEYNSKLKQTDTLTTAVKSAAQDAIASGLTQMFDTLAQGIANVITGAGSLKDLFSDLGRSVLNFAAMFAKAIADAIIQLAALRIAKSIIGGFHGGGEVGEGAGQMKLSRNLGAVSLASVPRYHEGTQSAGLKSDEMFAVLQKGEKVQTEEQQRLESNRLEAARAGSGRDLKQVLAFGDDQIAGAMAGPAGEDVTITHIRRNAPMIKQLLS